MQKFLAATARGYEYAARHPAEAAELLCQTASDTALDKEMVKESMQLLSQVRIHSTTSHLCNRPVFDVCTVSFGEKLVLSIFEKANAECSAGFAAFNPIWLLAT